MVNLGYYNNIVTIQDTNLPSSIDEFSEEFVGYIIASLIDFFLGYNQIILDIKSQDLIVFMIPLRLL
jgi:hypothetical protein